MCGEVAAWARSTEVRGLLGVVSVPQCCHGVGQVPVRGRMMRARAPLSRKAGAKRLGEWEASRADE